MYDVGFGDCFLVRVPTREGVRKILFDCGSLKKGAVPIGEVVRQVIEDARDADGVSRLDVVVATHRHRDHISGFADPAWADVRVQEVWMPWTEDPEDTDVKRIRDFHNRLASRLASTLEARATASLNAEEKERLQLMHAFALNSLTNESAMRTLQSGFAGRPERRYLPRENTPLARLETPALPDVTVQIMGPSRSADDIEDLNPPAGEHYLRLAESLEGGGEKAPCPFGSDWQMEPGEYASDYGDLANALTSRDRDAFRDAGSGFDEGVALALDKVLNGTSLMIVLQVGGATLLFPGDAQWGTWRRALENDECRRILTDTRFYKVGHHGSHNATPVDFVEKVVGRDFWAMISTCGIAQWPDIPKKELLEALRGKTQRMARSDRPEESSGDKSFASEGRFVIEAIVPI
jgi:beta-lactamase superfamily II metal-dependent hydrolase